MTQRSHRLASLIAHLVPGETAVRLLPAGEFRSADGSGRPTDAPAWRIDAAQAAILIARDTARSSRRVVDYEHQTLLAAKNGNPAPAAGWIGALEWREGDGLYAQIEWTEKAAAMIAAGEYRGSSPRARGTVWDDLGLHAHIRFIPASAGNSQRSPISAC